MTISRSEQIAQLEKEWEQPRWKGITRPYSAEDVIKLRGSVNPEHTLARRGAQRLWSSLNGKSKKGYVNALGALTGGQALQQAKAGLEAVYLSGWQVVLMLTLRQACILISLYIRLILFLMLYNVSIIPLDELIKFSGQMVLVLNIKIILISSFLLWLMRKRALVVY